VSPERKQEREREKEEEQGSLSAASLALALDNIGPYLQRLPPRHRGLVTVQMDNTQGAGGGGDAYGLALAALVRDGCVVLGKAVTAENCDACMQQVHVCMGWGASM
jgi:hypothetical protein